MKKGFTLIELLVVIAILAVLATAVILVINPAELIKQARDSTRVSDLAAVNSAVSLYLADVKTPGLGGTAGLTCTNMARCTYDTVAHFGTLIACNTYATTTIDGLGWVAVDLRQISSGSPLAKLPIDPNNGSSNCSTGGGFNCEYSYGCDALNYEIDAGMESTKFKNGGSGDVETKDGGDQAHLYEVGNNVWLKNP